VEEEEREGLSPIGGGGNSTIKKQVIDNNRNSFEEAF
jgi:hypothetical protein